MLNLLRDNFGARKKSKALGRGIGSGKGKTSARGGKGQTARTGIALNGFEGGQTPLHRRLPKRGFNNLNKQIYNVINLQDVQSLIEDKKVVAEEINENILKKLGFLSQHNSKVKLLAKGQLKSKITIRVHAASKSAEATVIAFGGKVKII